MGIFLSTAQASLNTVVDSYNAPPAVAVAAAPAPAETFAPELEDVGQDSLF